MRIPRGSAWKYLGLGGVEGGATQFFKIPFRHLGCIKAVSLLKKNVVFTVIFFSDQASLILDVKLLAYIEKKKTYSACTYLHQAKNLLNRLTHSLNIPEVVHLHTVNTLSKRLPRIPSDRLGLEQGGRVRSPPPPSPQHPTI